MALTLLYLTVSNETNNEEDNPETNATNLENPESTTTDDSNRELAMHNIVPQSNSLLDPVVFLREVESLQIPL